MTPEAPRNSRPLDVETCISGVGLEVIFRDGNAAAWSSALAALDYIPVAYSAAWIDYQSCYHQASCSYWRDLSMVLLHDRRPCGVWPLSISVAEGRFAVNSHGSSVLPPMFAPALSKRSRKVIVQRCLDLWRVLCEATGVTAAESSESYTGARGPGLSDWYEQSMRRGARAAVRHELFVDLSLAMEDIKARIRKSYRALISSGARAWRVGEMTAADPVRWNAFRQLHIDVAGRVTRSAASWELQHRAIADGDALLIYLLDEQERMVGGGFFGLTRDEGTYSVGAYDRSLFDKPLGHVVQHHAIELLKKRGVRWYKIGSRPYVSELPAPTEKELSIGEFKQGFATHLFPRYVLEHEFKNADAH